MFQIRIPLEYAYIFPKGEKMKIGICEKCNMLFIKGGCLCSEKKIYYQLSANKEKLNQNACEQNLDETNLNPL